MAYGYLADLIVAAHLAYAAFIVVGQAAIVVGVVRKWAWVRNPWFRFGHLAAIAVVAAEALLGVDCPLTLWEARLRGLAGQEVSGETFIGRLLHRLLFCEAAPWVLNACHVGFALLVIGTFVLAPPRFRRAGGVNPLNG
jgi:hypothetical protein